MIKAQPRTTFRPERLIVPTPDDAIDLALDHPAGACVCSFNVRDDVDIDPSVDGWRARVAAFDPTMFEHPKVLTISRVHDLHAIRGVDESSGKLVLEIFEITTEDRWICDPATCSDPYSHPRDDEDVDDDGEDDEWSENTDGGVEIDRSKLDPHEHVTSLTSRGLRFDPAGLSGLESPGIAAQHERDFVEQRARRAERELLIAQAPEGRR